jgi:hypothetical protein
MKQVELMRLVLIEEKLDKIYAFSWESSRTNCAGDGDFKFQVY